VNTVTVSFNAITGLMTKMSQRKKEPVNTKVRKNS